MKKLLILGGKPIGSVEIVRRAKELGYYTIVTDYLDKEDSPAKREADEDWSVSTAHIEELTELSIKHGICGVTTGVHEFNINRMLDLCERMNLPCYCSREAWQYCDNKLMFKNLCAENSIPIAKKYTINAVCEIDFPVITKPVDGSGSRGFHICSNFNELKAGYEDALSYSPSGQVLIEEYIPYNSVIIHYTLQNGKCNYSGMSDKISVKFKNTGSSVMGIQTFPSKGENIYMKTLNERVCRMFEKAGFKNGPMWIEAFYDGVDKFIFNEIGYRFGGSLTYYPVKYFYGTNQLDALIQNAMGETSNAVIGKRICHQRKYCILPVHIKAGKIMDVIGEDSIRQLDDVYAFVPVHFKGDNIQNWGSAQQVFCYLHILYDSIDGLKKSIKEILLTLYAINEHGENMLYTLFDLDSIPNIE